MAHEMISFDGRSRAFHHLEIELCFRSLINEMMKSPSQTDVDTAKDWQEGLRYSEIGLINVDLHPHFQGPKDARRLLHLLDVSRRKLPQTGSVPVSDLNSEIGTTVQTSNDHLDTAVIDNAFEKMKNFISGA